MMTDNKNDASNKPNKEISVRDAFGIETDMLVKGFEEGSDRVLILMKLINLILTLSHFGGLLIIDV